MKPYSIPAFKIIIVALTLSFFMVSCAKKLTFNSSAIVPAAEGTVKYKKDKNKNYDITVKVINLAEAKRLSPPRDGYVVWMETKENGVKNLGKLKVSSGLFSNSLKGSLNATTPFEPRYFYITAEDNNEVSYPSKEVVLRTN